MTSTTTTTDWPSFLLGGLIVGLLVFVLMMGFGVNKWHTRTCVERFNQATTSSDSLVVVQQDAFCLIEIDDD